MFIPLCWRLIKHWHLHDWQSTSSNYIQIKYDQNLSYSHWQKVLSQGPGLQKGRKSLCILHSACFATHVSIQTRLHHICIVYIYIYILPYCCFSFQAAMSKAAMKLPQGSMVRHFVLGWCQKQVTYRLLTKWTSGSTNVGIKPHNEVWMMWGLSEMG